MEVHLLLTNISIYLSIYLFTYFAFYLLRSKKEKTKQNDELWDELRSITSKFTLPHKCLSDNFMEYKFKVKLLSPSILS